MAQAQARVRVPTVGASFETVTLIRALACLCPWIVGNTLLVAYILSLTLAWCIPSTNVATLITRRGQVRALTFLGLWVIGDTFLVAHIMSLLGHCNPATKAIFW